MKRMNSALATAGVVVLGAIGLLGACERSNAVSTTTTTSAVTVLNDMATENIAYARCQHANACNYVGESRAWPTLESCMGEQRQRTSAAINISQCPRGIDGYALQSCMTAIDRASCDYTGPLNECLKTQLCQ
jgi:hypothetical protein